MFTGLVADNGSSGTSSVSSGIYYIQNSFSCFFCGCFIHNDILIIFVVID